MTETITAPARKRARFNALTVSEIRQLTDAAIEVAFAIPEELIQDYNYVPGQYVACVQKLTAKKSDARIPSAPNRYPVKFAWPSKRTSAAYFPPGHTKSSPWATPSTS